MDIRPNNTIYINNLNEKVKKEGNYRRNHRKNLPFDLRLSKYDNHPFFPYRTKEVTVCNLFPVWPGNFSFSLVENLC